MLVLPSRSEIAQKFDIGEYNNESTFARGLKYFSICQQKQKLDYLRDRSYSNLKGIYLGNPTIVGEFENRRDVIDLQNNSCIDISALRHTLGPETYSIWIAPGSVVSRVLLGRFRVLFWEQYGRGIYFQAGRLRAMGMADKDNNFINFEWSEIITPATGEWHHIAATFAVAGGLFVDGERVVSGRTDSGYNYAFGLGGALGAGNEQDNTFLGRMHDARVWNRVLTDDEIRVLYRQTKNSLYGEIWKKEAKSYFLAPSQVQPPTANILDYTRGYNRGYSSGQGRGFN